MHQAICYASIECYCVRCQNSVVLTWRQISDHSILINIYSVTIILNHKYLKRVTGYPGRGIYKRVNFTFTLVDWHWKWVPQITPKFGQIGQFAREIDNWKLIIRLSLEIFVDRERVSILCVGGHDPTFLVFWYSLLEEVRLSFQGNVLHEGEGILGHVHLRIWDYVKLLKHCICWQNDIHESCRSMNFASFFKSSRFNKQNTIRN